MIKAITALASMLTACLLVPMLPKLLALPSPSQLQAINVGLETEIRERKSAEERVRQMNAELEHRVSERTAELLTANEQLAGGNRELRTEIERRKALEGQLIHAQKMEAVGRLAGGVAHDFNNILTVMLGWSEMILAQSKLEETVARSAEEIRNAALRAAALTGQLLAFSRKQVLQPRVTDLNATVREIEAMLRRLLGDDIELVSSLTPALGMVLADPPQLQQVIMNLAINARDAMPRGGKLVLETSNLKVDEAYCYEHVDVTAGTYVVLSITDTGHGMDAPTKARIFEPFFTTKEQGKGTGLGLSTVFGIVKQSGGHVLVYSEVGQGTTFRVLLPRVEETVAPGLPVGETAGSGTETVLLCEDNEEVRLIVRAALSSHGYTVIEASSAPEALLFCTRYTGPIHLLLTDVVLHQGSGPELAAEVRSALPEVKVLFISGYAENAVLMRGVLEEGQQFLQKPFTPNVLCQKVRAVLDA
jgi:signal transduction histidine kinase